jgi:uroporphyrin-III C-methyltransferase
MSVFLVGAGPGDPGLVTVRGLELVRRCDVLIYDRLVAPELVAEAPAEALLFDRGARSQEEVNELLVEHGRAGRTVVRLKGGDPFVFGRGGEEALVLAQAGLSFEVVPGVSALSAVPGAAAIPITHRGVAAQVTVASGRSCVEGAPFDAAALARAPGTIVLFMALARLGELAAGLIEEGKDRHTPAAVIANGTRPEQETVAASLGELAEAAAGLPSPALVVIGDVVALRNQLRGRSPSVSGDTPRSSTRNECFRTTKSRCSTIAG